jgi:hypothetical protein
MIPQMAKVSEPERFFSLINNNRTIFVVFSGHMHKLGMRENSHKFLRQIHEKGCDVVCFKDNKKSWYHFGIDGMGNSIDELSSYIKQITKGYDFVGTFGNSMGGYASLLFGSLIEADVSIAVVPQTFIDDQNRRQYRDSRNGWDKSRVARTTSHKEMLDLKSYFESEKFQVYEGKPSCNIIFYGGSLLIDGIHARRMAHLKNFHIFRVLTGDHASGKMIRDAGIFDKLLDKIVSRDNLPRSLLDLLMKEALLEYHQNDRTITEQAAPSLDPKLE